MSYIHGSEYYGEPGEEASENHVCNHQPLTQTFSECRNGKHLPLHSMHLYAVRFGFF